MIYFGLTPGFVNYTLNDEVAITLSRFLNYALIPEELFYSTLFMIPGILYIKLKIIGSMHHTDTCMHVIAWNYALPLLVIFGVVTIVVDLAVHPWNYIYNASTQQ